MSNCAPRVSIGLPVYNGARYLAETLDSLLAQTYTDFELIISDNASTDATEAIGRAYAARDPRVRYTRTARNLGAGPNFNRVVALARGEYFKWAAHDDLCAPEFLARCVAVLDRDPSVALCFPRYAEIDAVGRFLAGQTWTMDLADERPHVRLATFLAAGRGHAAVFGLVRTDVLKQTGLFANYWGSDRALLAALCLRGKLHQLDEELLFWRDHPARSPYAVDRTAFFNAKSAGRIEVMHVRHALNYGRILCATPLGSSERLRCATSLIVAVLRRSGEFAPILLNELTGAARQVGARMEAR